MDRKLGFRSVRSFAIVIRRVYFEAKKCRKYAKNVVVNMSVLVISVNFQIMGKCPCKLSYKNMLLHSNLIQSAV